MTRPGRSARLAGWLPVGAGEEELGTDAQNWVNLQAQHDLWVASQKKPPNVKPLRQAA
jgi:hypothetical protein